MAVTEDRGIGGQRVDFFISYAGADAAWAEWVATVLGDCGYTTILQAWNFVAGSNFILEMHDALVRSERVVPLLSDAYLRSAFAAPEWAAVFAGDPTGRRRRLLPVRVGDCTPGGLLSALVYVDLVGLEEVAAKWRLLQALRPPGRQPCEARFPGQGPVAFPGALPPIWEVPARNPNFAGRDRYLDDLRAALGSGTASVTVLAVSGLAGVGKSQLAVEYCWRHASAYDLVWWVPAEVPAAIPASLATLAERLGLSTDNPAAAVGLLHAELGRRARWLIVFDNAENPSSVAPYLPPAGGGDLLVTSRSPTWRALGAALDLDVWSAPEAVAFILGRTGSDDEAEARAVADELGLLPLALEQAGAFIDETGMALRTYRELLATRRGEVLERGSPAFYRRTVAATFALAHERAAELNATAADLVEICAFLGPDDIPAQVVASGDPLADEEALATLRRLSLLRRQGDALAVHRLVGDVVRERLGPAGAARRGELLSPPC